MNSREIIKKLQDDGWFLYHTKGDNHKFKHPEKPGKVTVPNIEVHKDNPDFKDGIWALVEVDISKLSLKPNGSILPCPKDY